MSEKRDSFTFKRIYLDAIDGLGAQAKLEVLEAIFRYVFDETDTALKQGRAETAWKLIKYQLDVSAKKRDAALKGWNAVRAAPKQCSGNAQIKRQKPKNKSPKADVFAEFAGGDEKLLRTLRDFNEMRTRIKHPMTDRARTMLCNKLRKFNRSQWVAILEQSVYAGWQDIYDLKQPEPQQNKQMEFPKL